MKRQIQMAVFISMFVLVFVLIHFYVLSSLFSLFHLQKTFLFYTLLLLLSFSYAIAAFIDRKLPGKFSRALYIAVATWLGAVFLLVFLVLIYNILSLFLSIPDIAAGTTILAADIILAAWGVIHCYNIKTKEITLYFQKNRLKKNIRIAQLSDIHLGAVNTKNFLEEVVEKTNSLNPDIVAMTGDLVDGSAPPTLEMLKPLKKLKAPIFFVIGNHEIYDDLDFVMPILKKTKMKIIRNSVTSCKGIQIAGIDYYETDKPAVEAIEKLKVDSNRFVLLLNHAPTGFEKAAERGFDLQLSGHTHNGQIFPFNLFVKLRYKFLSGLYRINDSFLVISQGAGTWGPPMRFLTDSEIVVVDLKKGT